MPVFSEPVVSKKRVNTAGCVAGAGGVIKSAKAPVACFQPAVSWNSSDADFRTAVFCCADDVKQKRCSAAAAFESA